MMEIYIFDKDINAIGIVENYSSLRWLSEYNGLGEFQLTAIATDDNLNLFKQDNLIWKNDGDTCGVIQFIEIKNDTIEIRGKLSNKLMEDRILLKQLTVGNIEESIRRGISENALADYNDIDFGGRNLWINKNAGSYLGGQISSLVGATYKDYTFTITSSPKDLVGCRIDNLGKTLTIQGETDLKSVEIYYIFNNSSQLNRTVSVVNNKFEYTINVPIGASYLNIGIGRYPHVGKYFLSKIQVNSENASTPWTPAPEDIGYTFALDSRVINHLVLAPTKLYTDSQVSQFTYKTLFELINSFDEIGFKTKLDIENKKHIFDLYKGEDISDNVVFSEDFDNLIDTIITMDNSEYKNVAVVAGRGEGINRRIRYLDISPIGQEKREMFVDYKDMELEDANGVAYTEQQIEDMMRNKGWEKLVEQLELNSFQATIVADSNYKYKQDYNLGDVIICKSDRFNVLLKVRITGIQEIYDSNGYQILAILGDK